VKVKLPATVGVPVIAAELLRLSPAGNDPEVIDHARGALPPVAASGCEYGSPTRPVCSDGVVIVNS
jgi:hypothetical protein